ncbi:uncharacterized protein LOC135376084 [Ornithodoros turicata]|uniref:uncharacterized protein LOC135376084 n=1 Tax=Ornithodoros turicata TaxID=34597 RepID=UPI003138CC58
MSVASFVHVLRRFFVRRGMPRVIYSDNAPTFKRYNKELAALWRRIRDDQVLDWLGTNSVSWKFIPTNAPWWGGFYERLIRSVKQALKKTIGRKSLTYGDLVSIVAEVEAVTNSRPLSYVYDDPHEILPLTPAEFITGRRLTIVPPQMTTEETEPICRTWQKRATLLQAAWRRWQRHYLMELRSANQWKRNRGKTMSPGDVVISEERKPRMFWPLVRIQSGHKRQDGTVRSYTVRKSTGHVTRRASRSLYPLEIQQHDAAGPQSVANATDIS